MAYFVQFQISIYALIILVAFSNALKSVFNNEAVIARLGGDEFAVVVEKNTTHIEERIEDLKNKLLEHKDTVVQGLQFSYGYEDYDGGGSIDHLNIRADKKMYLYKQKHHQK